MPNNNMNEVPIRWGKYINHDMQEQKVIFLGAEKAIFDKDGVRMDDKNSAIKGDISDEFSETKDYVTGDYCIYLNRLYKFTAPKPAGPWDGTKVVPVSLAQEIQGVKGDVVSMAQELEITTSLGNETIASLVDLVPDDSTRKFYVNKKPDGPDLSYSHALLTIEKHYTAIYLQMHINIDNLRYQAFYWGDTGVLTPQIWEKSIGSKYFDANMWQLTNANAISIPENSDMKSNTYKALGVYVCETNAKARNLSNCPTDQAFTLIVYKTLDPSGGYTTQEFRAINNDIAKRYWDGYTNKWYNEVAFLNNDNINQFGTITSNYMNLTSSKIVKIGNIVVATGSFTMKVNANNVNPLISFSFMPITLAPVLMLVNGSVITGNIWVNTSGNVGIGSSVNLQAGTSGAFSTVYLTS